MEFASSKESNSMFQRKYKLDLLKKTRFLGCKTVETPIDPTCKLGLLKEIVC